MDEDVSRDKAGSEMGQASFQGFLKDVFSAEEKAEEFAEKIPKREEGSSQDRDAFFKKEDRQEHGKKENRHGGNLFVLFVFVDSLYLIEKEEVNFLRDKPNEVGEEEKKGDAPDERQNLFFL